MRPSLAPLMALLVFSAGASAQAPDPAVATELFRQGRELMQQGQWAEACPKLEESHRLQPGGGVLLNLALCHAGQGKLATAWGELNTALALARRDGRADREELALKEIAAIEPRLSRLTVHVPEASRLPGLELRRNGALLGTATWGSALPVDGGVQVLEASAPGHAPWRHEVTVAPERDLQRVEVPALAPAPEPAPAPSASAPPVTAPPAPFTDTSRPGSAPPPPAEAETGGTQRWLGYGLVGLGVVGLGVTGYFGWTAQSASADADAICAARCTAESARLDADALTAADRATGAFIVSSLALAGGVTLLVLAPEGGPSGGETVGAGTGRTRGSGSPRAGAGARAARVSLTPLVGPGGAAAVLRGVF